MSKQFGRKFIFDFVLNSERFKRICYIISQYLWSFFHAHADQDSPKFMLRFLITINLKFRPVYSFITSIYSLLLRAINFVLWALFSTVRDACYLNLLNLILQSGRTTNCQNITIKTTKHMPFILNFFSLPENRTQSIFQKNETLLYTSKDKLFLSYESIFKIFS